MSVASRRCALSGREEIGIVLAVLGTGLTLLSFLPRYSERVGIFLSPKVAGRLLLLGIFVMLIGMLLANVTPILM